MRGRILVVDDNLSLAENVGELLELFGFSAWVCFGPRDALEVARREPFDGAVLDIHMPEMDGIALCQELERIRADAVYVFMSACAEEAHGWAVRSAGGRPVLPKPFPVNALLDALAPVGRAA